MELTKKGVAGVVAGTAATVVVSTVIAWVIATSSAGVDAAERQRIVTILNEEMTLDDQRTIKEAVSSLDKNYAVLAGDVANIDENIALMRGAVQALAATKE